MDKTRENPNPSSPIPELEPGVPQQQQLQEEAVELWPERTPFTSLSQEDSDLALARTLQEQEWAFMMLSIDGGEYEDSWSGEEYEDEDESDLPPDGEDGSVYRTESSGDGDAQSSDADVAPLACGMCEACSRAVQEVEGHAHNSQVALALVDPDTLTYEELIALGEVVGTESKGLSADMIASLPSSSYKEKSAQGEHNHSCIICQLDYEDGDSLIALPCKHSYHSECINNWLQMNKVCPLCSAEISSIRG